VTRRDGVPAFALVGIGVALNRCHRCGQCRHVHSGADQHDATGAHTVAGRERRVPINRAFDDVKRVAFAPKHASERLLEVFE
jgi:hypothetical protein